MRWVVLILWLSALEPLVAQPAQILILRHGEKPDEPAALHLSPRGQMRANALPSLLGKGSFLTSNAPVAAIYASRATKRGAGQRPGETVAPLARSLGVPLQTPFLTEQYAQMAHSILSNPAYRGKTVILCWTHHDLADLAGALGADPKPPKWKEDVYDRVWRVSFEGGRVCFQDLPQRLLRGDAKK